MHGGAFAVGGLGRRLVDYAMAGVMGAAIARAGAAGAPKVQPALRRLAVGAVAGGIVFSRRVGAMTEEARLAAGDVVAEARKQLGEETRPPTSLPPAGHEH